MKKISTTFLLLFSLFIIIGCDNGTNDENGKADDTEDIVIDLPTEPVDLTFWHLLNEENQNLLDSMVDSFKEKYPDLDVTITQSGLGNPGTLVDQALTAMESDQGPTMMAVENAYINQFIDKDYVLALDDFMNDEAVGIDQDDFIQGVLDDNNHFGGTYSMPLFKTSDVIVYNKDVFDHHAISIPDDRAITWDDLASWNSSIVGNGDMQTEYLLDFEWFYHFYVDALHQQDANYRDDEGRFLVGNDDGKTEDLLLAIKTALQANTITYNQTRENPNYLSFKNGYTAMVQGSHRAVERLIPTTSDDAQLYGQFEVGFIPAFQTESCNFDQDDTPCAVNLRGLDVMINANATEDEQRVAWLFLKHLTSTENTAQLSIDTGYLPVRHSAYDLTAYQDYLNTEYNPDGDNTQYYQAQATKAAYKQVNFLYTPAPLTAYDHEMRVFINLNMNIARLYWGDHTTEFVMTEIREYLNYLSE